MSPHEDVELVGVEELYALFERRRPGREAFRAGIEERIGERRAARGEERAEREEEGADEPARSSLWRRAAAFLPLDPAGGALAGSGLAKTLGGKALPAALALPVLALASAFGGFLAGTRSLRRSVADALPVDATTRRRALRHARGDRSVRAGGRLTATIQLGAMAAFLVTWLFGGGLAIDLLTLVLVVSMAALVVTVRGFARVGLLNRSDVARLAVGVLCAVFTGCFLWFHNLRLADDVSGLGQGWASTVVLLGIPACLVAGGWRRSAALALALGLVFALALNTPGVTRSSRDSLRSQLAGLRLDPASLGDWREAAALHGALGAVGAALPDLTEVRERVARAARSQDGVHPVVWTAANAMGLMEASDWRALASRELERHRLDQLQEHRRFSLTPYYQYVFPMLLATREVSPQQREELARKVLASWPEIGEHGALSRALACVAELDALGRSDLTEQLREPALRLLAAYWVSGAGSGPYAKVGGFTSNPQQFKTSFDDATLDGVELMARFGVPDGVDLRLLHSHLRRECHSIPLVFEALPHLKAQSRAALLRLREQIGMPARTRFESLLDERLLIATLLIVALCLTAVRLAPPLVDPTEHSGGGAQP